jgi:hypothetical protein
MFIDSQLEALWLPVDPYLVKGRKYCKANSSTSRRRGPIFRARCVCETGQKMFMGLNGSWNHEWTCCEVQQQTTALLCTPTFSLLLSPEGEASEGWESSNEIMPFFLPATECFSLLHNYSLLPTIPLHHTNTLSVSRGCVCESRYTVIIQW